MKNLNKIIWFLLGGATLIAGSVFAVNLQPSFVPSLVPIIDSNYDLGTSTKLWRYIYMAGSDGCLQLSTNVINSTGIACGSGGGGSGGGSWSTTTSTHTGRLINYPNNTTDIVVIGGTATTTSNTEYWFDPNTQNAHIGSSNSASTTVMGNLFLPTVGQGFFYGGSNGLLSAIASSSIKLSWFNNDSAFLTGVTADSPLSGAGTSASHLVLSTAGTWSGNAGTATALAANGANCTAGNYPLGVDASGAVETCTAANTGTVTSVTLATPNSTLSLGGTNPVTTSGTINADLNLGHTNTWTILQNFNYSSSTIYSSFLNASSTFLNAGSLTIATTSAGCAAFMSSGLLVSTGAACGSGAGGGVTSVVAGAGFQNQGLNITTSGTLVGAFASSSAPSLSNLSYVTGVGDATTPIKLGFVATSSETCSSPLSCTSFDVLTGGGAITLNTVTVAKGGTNATSFAANSIITSDSAGTTLIATTSQLTVGSLLSTSTVSNNILLNSFTGIGTSTPKWLLQLATSTVPQLTLSDGTNVHWSFRNAGGNLYLATSSATTFATTSSVSTLSILTNGALGMGTSSPVSMFTVSGGAILNDEAKPATTTAMSVSLASSTATLIQLGTSATTVTLYNLFAGQASRVTVCNPNATAGAITWATSPANKLLWTGGVVPIQTTTANKCDIWTFTTTQATSTTGSVILLGSQVPNF